MSNFPDPPTPLDPAFVSTVEDLILTIYPLFHNTVKEKQFSLYPSRFLGEIPCNKKINQINRRKTNLILYV